MELTAPVWKLSLDSECLTPSSNDNPESELRPAAEVTGNSLSALLDSHPYHVPTHICLCLRTLGVYIMIVNLTFRHCFNDFEGPVFILTKCHSARAIWVQ